MAQFIPFAPNVEVNGETVLSFINAFPEYLSDIGNKMLAKHGIINPLPGKWYCQAAWLKAFKAISEKFGANTLFEIGKAIPSSANFPPDIDSFEKALESIDVAYHMNHRNGEIGFYKLVGIDYEKKQATMQCKNPYPCDFDRGIITAMARKFVSQKIQLPAVNLDKSKPNRLNGADESWYIITWQT